MQKKMIIVNQVDSKDCGPCCLKSIVEYYGGYVSLEIIKEHTYITSKGTSVYHLVQAAKKYGFDAIAKKYLDNQIYRVHLPAIVYIHYENGLTHFMVLYSVTNDKVILMDPAKGKVTMRKNEFEKIFTGIGIELSLKNEIIKLEKESKIYDVFLNVLKNNKKICFNLLSCSIILSTLTIIYSLYFKICYELIQNNSYPTFLKMLIYLFLIVCLLKLVFTYLKSYYENHLNKNIDVGIYQSFISHIFKLPLKVINQKSIGEIITRIGDISNIKDFLSEFCISGFLNLILSIGSLIILFCLNKILAFILCLVMILYLLISFFTSSYLYKRILQNIDYATLVNANLVEKLEMINSIKNLNKTNNVLENLEYRICDLIYDNYDFSHLLNVLSFFKNLIFDVGIFTINTIGFYLIFQNKFTLVNLVIFNTLLTYFVEPIKSIESLIPKFNYLRASIRRICDFINIKEESIGEEENFINGNIKFENVGFSYNDYLNNLSQFNLTIKHGEKIAIKGESGSGKSTLCNLLLKNYHPTKGNIWIGNKNLDDYSLATIRKNIVYVGQKENVMNETIKNNILFYEENAEKFDEVCRICLIDKIVDKKRFRYEFGIDNNFSNISGGEKQRIVLARALLKGGEILVLDEALSELDIKLERRIIKNIIKTYPKKTLIYITHKNHDVFFDRVITMERYHE